jgi:hypothetical protein
VPKDAARKVANRAVAEAAKAKKDRKKIRKAERERARLWREKRRQGLEESDDDDDDDEEEEEIEQWDVISALPSTDWVNLEHEDEVVPLSAMGPFLFHTSEREEDVVLLGMTEVGRPVMSDSSTPKEGTASVETAETDRPTAPRSPKPREETMLVEIAVADRPTTLGSPELREETALTHAKEAWLALDDPAPPGFSKSREGPKRPRADEV